MKKWIVVLVAVLIASLYGMIALASGYVPQGMRVEYNRLGVCCDDTHPRQLPQFTPTSPIRSSSYLERRPFNWGYNPILQ